MMKPHKIYFGAGPAALPAIVMEQAAQAVISYADTGLSILEIPHRGKAFMAIIEESNALVKKLCGLSDDYDVIWLQGGGRHQFAMVPMNFLDEQSTAGYIDSGHWSHEAILSGRYYGNVSVLATTRDNNYTQLPEWPIQNDDLSYIHFTTNNTIYGTQFSSIPDSKVPLIADMSSDIFSMKRDYSKCGLFYAVVQKNVGPAGATLVAIRKDMYGRKKRHLPEIFDYEAQAKAGSLLNTPPVFSIYTSLLMLRWIKQKGMEVIEKENREKAAMLYKAVDESAYFNCPVEHNSRSLMNVVFRGIDESIEQKLKEQCAAANITGIEGHRFVGGFRASLYNAVSVEDTRLLADIITQFKP